MTFNPERIGSGPLSAYLDSGETYTREELLAAGLTEEQVGDEFLIRIEDDANVVHFLKFQFDHTDDGQPIGLNETVMLVNEVTGADTDPLGMGDWWTGPDAWLPPDCNTPMAQLAIRSKENFIDFLEATLLAQD